MKLSRSNHSHSNHGESGSAWCAASATACSARPGSSCRRPAHWGPAWSGPTCTGRRSNPSPASTAGTRWTPCSASWPATRSSGSRCAPARRGGPGSRPTSCRPRPPWTSARTPSSSARWSGTVPTGPGRPGPVLAVRQRAEQHRPALGGHRGRVRRAAADHVRRGQGGRPGRGGRPRRLRLRRVQQRARQRAAAVLRPRRQGRPRRVRPVQRAPVRRPGPHPRVHGHRQAVHAGARVPQARRGGRARRAAAVRVPRRDGGHAGDLRRRLRRGRRVRALAEHRTSSPGGPGRTLPNAGR